MQFCIGNKVEALKTLCIVITFSLCMNDCLTQDQAVVISYTSKPIQNLSCPITADTLVAIWSEEIAANNKPLFTYSGDPDDIANTTVDVDPVKYNNFDYVVIPDSRFNLLISDVDKDDGGIYPCTVVRTDTPPAVVLFVEVLPDSMDITCTPLNECPGPDVTVSDLPCTCAAFGVRPDSLNIEWVDVSSYNESGPDVTIVDDLYNINSSAVLQPTRDDDQVACEVTGYNDTNIEVTKRSKVLTTFTPPKCGLSVLFSGDCTAAYLECSCTGAFPEVVWYSYFDENYTVVNSSSSTIAEVTISGNGTYTFSCRGCNGVNYGNKSIATSSATCTILQTTTEQTATVLPTDPQSNGLNTAAWIGIGVASAVGGGLIIFLFCCWFCRDKDKKKNKPVGYSDNQSDTAGGGAMMNEAYRKDDEELMKKTAAFNQDSVDPYGEIDLSANRESKEEKKSKKNRKGENTAGPEKASKPEKAPQPELQYANLDHGKAPASDKVHQPVNKATAYAEVNVMLMEMENLI